MRGYNKQGVQMDCTKTEWDPSFWWFYMTIPLWFIDQTLAQNLWLPLTLSIINKIRIGKLHVLKQDYDKIHDGWIKLLFYCIWSFS